MSEIAMLVAEEYERLVKNSRKNGDGSASEEIDLFSSAFVLARKVKTWSSSSLINNHFGEEKMKPFKGFVEPKSQIGVAAINGFFSA
ncbi:hypothetical protein U1Q18_039416 [Sarracenia purpurea var. burkii]